VLFRTMQALVLAASWLGSRGLLRGEPFFFNY
jgi:hypothetical protein